MKPYWIWTIDVNMPAGSEAIMMVDVGKAEYIYWNQEHEKSIYKGYTVRAKIEKGETRTDEDFVLTVKATEDEAIGFMGKLAADMNGDRHRPGMPIITKTVSPESVEKVKESIVILAGLLDVVVSILALAIGDGEILRRDDETRGEKMFQLGQWHVELSKLLPAKEEKS